MRARPVTGDYFRLFAAPCGCLRPPMVLPGGVGAAPWCRRSFVFDRCYLWLESVTDASPWFVHTARGQPDESGHGYDGGDDGLDCDDDVVSNPER